MNVTSAVIPWQRVAELWPMLENGIDHYRTRTPHQIGTLEEIREFLQSPQGDEVFVIAADGMYAGLMTFRVAEVEGERWGTIAMLYLELRFQNTDVLAKATQQLEEVLRSRGCQIMNWLTARKGFHKLAPRLGFRPRIIEWMKEL